MKKKTRKLNLKKATVTLLATNLAKVAVGGSRRCSADASGCAGTGACCHHTK